MAKSPKTKIFLEEPKDQQQRFFRVPNWFDLKQWLEYADRLGEHGAEIDRKSDWVDKWGERFAWDVGDWLLEGEAGKLPMRQLKEYADQKFPEYAWHTLRNWKVTCRAIESSRRQDGREGRGWLPFSTHQVVEKYPPEQQEQFLQAAVERNLSVAALKHVIKTEFGSKGMGGRDTRKGRVWVPVTIKVPVKDHEHLTRLAGAKGFMKRHGKPDPAYDYYRMPGDVATLLWWMASGYYKEHKAELDALLKPANPVSSAK